MRELKDLKPGDPVIVVSAGRRQDFAVEKVGRKLLHATKNGRTSTFRLDTGVDTCAQYGYGTRAYTTEQWKWRERYSEAAKEWRTLAKDLPHSSKLSVEQLERIIAFIKEEMGKADV